MQNDERDLGQGDLAEIWRSAQHRRTEDIYSWFTQFFERQEQPQSSESGRPQYPQRRAAAWVWKLLEATHAVSRTTS